MSAQTIKQEAGSLRIVSEHFLCARWYAPWFRAEEDECSLTQRLVDVDGSRGDPALGLLTKKRNTSGCQKICFRLRRPV